MSYLKKFVYLAVIIGFSWANAGAYDDFFRAVIQDDPAAIRQLLQRGFDPDTVDPQGQTGLFIALRQPSLKAADALIAWPQTRVETRNVNDESPLMMAALKGHLAQAEALILRGADVNKPGWAPLHYAATGGQVAMIELLLAHHAYIDAESPNGSTPLMMAAMYGSREAVQRLLAAGADASLRNQLGLSARDFALRANRADVAALINPAPAGR